MRKIRTLALAALAAVSAFTALGASPAAAGPLGIEPQNTQLTYVWTPTGGVTCTVLAQFGQFGGAAYVQVQVVDAYSNRTSCSGSIRLVYNNGGGNTSGPAISDTKASGQQGWVGYVQNPAYFIFAYFQINVTDANGQSWTTGENLIGHWACPNGC